MRFWRPWPEDGYSELFWAVWVTSVAFALLAITGAALDHVPRATFDPTLHYTHNA